MKEVDAEVEKFVGWLAVQSGRVVNPSGFGGPTDELVEAARRCGFVVPFPGVGQRSGAVSLTIEIERFRHVEGVGGKRCFAASVWNRFSGWTRCDDLICSSPSLSGEALSGYTKREEASGELVCYPSDEWQLLMQLCRADARQGWNALDQTPDFDEAVEGLEEQVESWLVSEPRVALLRGYIRGDEVVGVVPEHEFVDGVAFCLAMRLMAEAIVPGSLFEVLLSLYLLGMAPLGMVGSFPCSQLLIQVGVDDRTRGLLEGDDKSMCDDTNDAQGRASSRPPGARP